MWKAETSQQAKIGEVFEPCDDGRVSIRFDNGRLLIGRDAGMFERLFNLGLKVNC